MSGSEKKGFRPDPAFVSGAKEALVSALARGKSDGAAYGEALEAAGRLVALGEPSLAAEALAGQGGLREVASALLGSDEADDELEDLAVILRRCLAELEDGAERGALAAEVGAALAGRDRAEFRLLGAALALDVGPDGIEAGAVGRLEFEALVRPELYRLCAFNPERRAALALVAPALRTRFWWQFEGVDLDPHAASALPAVAALVAAFPAAGERLASLVRAREVWSKSHTRATLAMARPAPPEGVVPAAGRLRIAPPAPAYTLRDWVERRPRRGAAGAVEAEALRLAAAPDDEALLLDGADYQISWGPTGLIVDLVADRRPGELPSLRLGDGSSVAPTAVSGAEERFSFSLPERAYGETNVLLTLPLARGAVELALPPGEGRKG